MCCVKALSWPGKKYREKKGCSIFRSRSRFLIASVGKLHCHLNFGKVRENVILNRQSSLRVHQYGTTILRSGVFAKTHSTCYGRGVDFKSYIFSPPEPLGRVTSYFVAMSIFSAFSCFAKRTAMGLFVSLWLPSYLISKSE